MTLDTKWRPIYEIGYGKPPKNTRFKPGVSGSRHGRPKGSKNTETLLKQELAATILFLRPANKSA
jgi:hypothetical protein